VALTESNHIELDDLPRSCGETTSRSSGPSFAAGESLRAWGSRYARLVYERCGRNKRRACRHLDISYHTLQAYLRLLAAGRVRRQATSGMGAIGKHSRTGARSAGWQMNVFYAFRYFRVVAVVPPLFLAGFVVTVAAAAVTLTRDPSAASEALTPVLLLQLFAASSGFQIPARRGYYDLLLTSESRAGRSRWRIVSLRSCLDSQAGSVSGCSNWPQATVGGRPPQAGARASRFFWCPRLHGRRRRPYREPLRRSDGC
jgi:hypothetical protein